LKTFVTMLLLASASWPVLGATISVGTATANPGQTVQIAVAVTGDGLTQGLDVELYFDEARLSLPVASGEIPGANASGLCARSTSRTVSAIIFSASAPLPAGSTTVCIVPFTVRANSRAGKIALRGSKSQCVAGQSQQPCSIVEGWIDVVGPPPLDPEMATVVETDSLAMLLRPAGEAPSVAELVGHDYIGNASNAPLEGLRHGVLRVRPPYLDLAAGDVLERLQRVSESPEAQAQRYVYADFASKQLRDKAYQQLINDPAIDEVYIDMIESWPASSGQNAATTKVTAKGPAAGTQDFLEVLNLPSAWALAEGWGLVGVLDNGLDPNHAQLRSFTGANSVGGAFVPGGNYLPFLSRNVGGREQPFANLHEIQPSKAIYVNDGVCDSLDGSTDGWLNYASAGHGTHVTGLVAANGLDNSSVRGACVRCGVASVKRSALACYAGPKVRIATHPDVDAAGITHLLEVGAQVISMSFSNDLINCQSASNNSTCTAIANAQRNDIVMVAAAGNIRSNLVYPARDPRVVSVGGLGESDAFWDESPGSFDNCPVPNSDKECGSNKAPDTVLTSRQEVVAAAKSVRSTFYPGVDWSTDFACGDSYGDGPANDGEGVCTGTSMSAPIVAGLYGLLRSINPLVRTGDPVGKTGVAGMPVGVREVVAWTASRSSAGLAEDIKMGFGIPNAHAAAQRMLGVVRGQPVRNRVTPLFGLFSPNGNDYATVATPQLALALQMLSTNKYRGAHLAGDSFIQGASIPGYAAYPNPLPAAGVPRARAMILTTDKPPSPLGSPLSALVLLEKKRASPVPCDATSPKCHGDFALTTFGNLPAAINAGYSYSGLQGYVYPTCAPEPACMPVATEKLHAKCQPAGQYQDCAVFTESDRLTFEAAGYTFNFLGAASSVLGYAYSISDADADGLVDALERVIGTSTADSDSDDDGVPDSSEFPLAGVPVSDPCAGPNITCVLGKEYVFQNGFE
jgi:serine protease